MENGLENRLLRSGYLECNYLVLESVFII